MIAVIVFTLAFTFTFFLHEKYRIKDEHTEDLEKSNYFKTQWHKAKGGIQIVVYAFVFYSSLDRSSSLFYAFAVTLFFASFFWMFHDGLLNSFLFKKDWWSTGTTAAIDKRFSKETISILKSICLGASIIMLLVWTIFF